MAENFETRRQELRGLAAKWTSNNTVLLDGEWGIESDTNKAKQGDGVTAWNSLPYFGGSGTLEGVINSDPVATSVPDFQGGVDVGNGATATITLDDGANGSISSNAGRLTVSHDANINLVAPVVSTTRLTTQYGEAETFAGSWNATTNSPVLDNTDTDTKAVNYEVSVAGSVNFGAGAIAFGIGDIVSNNGTIWFKIQVDNNQSGGGYTSPTYIANIEDYGAVADNGTTNSTSAFIAARDALVALGGGNLVIPNRGDDRFYITTGVTDSLADFSNITINGGGKIYVDELAGGATNSRGVFVRLADGTDNFKMYDLDILVNADAATDVTYENGVICSEIVNNCTVSNVFIEKVKIHSEVRLDTVIGNHGIVFTRIDISNQGTFTNINVIDCDVKLYGNSIYGVLVQQTGKGIHVTNNKLELTANTAAPDEAYNTIGVYGDSEDVNITDNHVYGGGHSPIAVSTAGRAVIKGNFVYDIAVTGEAGIEFEYKGGHGTVGYQPENCIISDNQVYNAYIGILIADRINDATSKSPRNVIVSDNIVKDSILSDIEFTSSFGVSGDNTHRISNIIIENNICDSSATEANIRSRDGSNMKITNNILLGAANGIKLGRNTSIKVRGDIDISGNTMRDYTTYAIYIETADDINLSVMNNKMYGGFRGFFSNSDVNVGGESSMQFVGNYVDGCTGDGMFITNSNVEGIVFTSNIGANCLDRAFHIDADYHIYANCVSRNCVSNPYLNGVGKILGNYINL